MARIVIAGAGSVGASLAYSLSLRGARDVVLVDRGETANGATGKAMGGIRLQFESAAELALVRESLPLFEEIGAPLFRQVGYLFLSVTEKGRADLRRRFETQRALGVPCEWLEPERAAARAPGVDVGDVTGALFGPKDGTADPAAITRELVRRAVSRGVTLLERRDVREIGGEILVLACGVHSAELARERGVELPLRPLCRQLFETPPIEGIADALPMVLESESGFHFRRRDDRLRVAMGDPRPRRTFEESVDASILPDRLARLARRFPAAAGATVERSWAGLYDMTPDAHPILGRVADGLFVACGFSGHGFMQSPAVGRGIAEEILDGRSSIDFSPFRLERFARGAAFDERAVL